ncbi:hypothetical protein [Halochromatium roseum]|uniref:hypothetical protein n=1 Tax=Halochromatium roseum TaxID=391920 RepID=UPI001912DBF6|nr:hypothetical protein [Halochromatium roseum]MBK5938187.1 hypothetical protein [Halochromatium roseum]
MQPHWTLNLKTGLKVNVPADLDNPVTLTLLELEDWPEPEHAFCRQLAQPGLRLLDADANGPSNASPERHTQADANGNTEAATDVDANPNADSKTEPSAQAALEKPATLFACNATRAAWLREQGRLIRPA